MWDSNPHELTYDPKSYASCNSANPAYMVAKEGLTPSCNLSLDSSVEFSSSYYLDFKKQYHILLEIPSDLLPTLSRGMCPPRTILSTILAVVGYIGLEPTFFHTRLILAF